MNDKLIRELLVNVKQVGSAKTTTSLNKVANAITDAAAGAELANEQFAKMSSSLVTIERSAQKAANSLNKVGVSPGMKTTLNTLKSIDSQLDTLISETVVMRETLTNGFNAVSKSATTMGNNIASAIEKSQDELIDLNRQVNKTTAGFNGINGAAGKASRAIGNTSGSARGATRDFAAMAKIGGSLPIMYAAIASNVFVLNSAFDQLRAGDQLNRLVEFGSIVGSLTGTPVQNLAGALQESTNYAISFEEAMKQASVASAYGFSTTQIEQFGLVARRAAAVLGIDMTDALNRVIKGVSKQEIELLDELGVTIRLNDAYQAYVTQLNAANTGITYNIQSLTTFQKQQAYANAVVAQSTKNFGQLDSALRATPWELFAATANSALSRLQQSAAQYLTPVIDSLNSFLAQTKAAGSLAQSVAQQQSIRTMDPNNIEASVASLANAKEGYDAAIKLQKEAQETRLKLKKDFDKQYDSADRSLQFAVRLGNQGLPNNMASGENKAWVDNMVKTNNQITLLDREIEDSKATVESWGKTYLAAGQAMSKANPVLQQSLKLMDDTSGVPGSTGMFKVDDNALAGVTAISKEFTQLKTTSKDTQSAISTIGTDAQAAGKAAAGLAEAIKTIEGYSKATGANATELVGKLQLNYKTLEEMKTAYDAISKYQKAAKDDGAGELEAEKAKAAVLANGGKTKQAENAANAVRARQLQDEITATQALLKLQPENLSLQKKINELQTDKLKAENSQLGTAEKVEKIRTKAIGIEEQIALAKDRTLTADQYSLASLQAQLKVDIAKAAALKDSVAQQADYKTQLLAIAQTERSISEETYKQSLDAKQRATAQSLAMEQASGERGIREQSAMNIRNLEQQILDIKLAAKNAGTAVDTATITGLQNQIAVLKRQAETDKATQSRGFQDDTTGLLGGSYGSTEGMSPEMKSMQEYQNNQDGYAQAISNLQSINSEATNAGQSIGNLVNAMMQYSKGSLNFSSVAAAGMQTVSQFIAYGAKQQVTAIDQAIAAEQARDGQSDKSKAKIKKLEAEKLKIQQDAAKKQILIQTAVAVMQAATSVPYPWSIPLMIAAAAAGAMSYAQASNASSSSLTGLDSGSTTASLSLGERNKSVDVSKQANSGELAYMQGGTGVGNANTFVPRAEGGNMLPGVGYITGENGIEVVTPSVPSKAIPADELSSGSSSGGSIIMHINTMDASSFRDFALSNQGSFRDAVEAALNENGSTLRRLN